MNEHTIELKCMIERTKPFRRKTYARPKRKQSAILCLLRVRCGLPTSTEGRGAILDPSQLGDAITRPPCRTRVENILGACGVAGVAWLIWELPNCIPLHSQPTKIMSACVMLDNLNCDVDALTSDFTLCTIKSIPQHVDASYKSVVLTDLMADWCESEPVAIDSNDGNAFMNIIDSLISKRKRQQRHHGRRRASVRGRLRRQRRHALRGCVL